MAQLPDTLPLVAPQGTRTPAVAPNVGDLGLGQVANDLSDWAATHRAVNETLDAREAGAKIDAMQAEFQPGFAERAARYTADDPPGFASREMTNLDGMYRSLLAGEKRPGVQRALNARYDQARHAIGEQAIGWEASKRAQPIADQQTASDNTKLGLGKALYASLKAPLDAATENKNIDGVGYAAARLSNHDQVAPQVLDSIPERLKGEFSSWLSAERVATSASGPAAEYERTNSHLYQGAIDQTNLLANATSSHPASYSDNLKQVAGIVSSLPPILREKAGDEINQILGESYGRGLIDHGMLDQAQSWLESGEADKYLKPLDKDRLQERLNSARIRGQRDSAQAWQDQHDATQDLNAATATIALTGLDSGYDPTKDKRRTGAEQAEGAQAIKDAHATFATTQGVEHRTNAELNQIGYAPQPEPKLPDGTPDPAYASKLQTWLMAGRAAETEMNTRTADPAAVVLRSSAPGDAGDRARKAWDTFTNNGDPASAGTYARLQLNQQDYQGTPRQNLKILTNDQAQALAGIYEKAAPQDRPAAFVKLAAMIGNMPAGVPMAHGGPVSARQIALLQLNQAGLSRGNMVAIADLGGNPNALHAYALADTNSSAGKSLPGNGDEAALQTALRQQLAPYVRSTTADPTASSMSAGRDIWTTIVARNLVLTRGMSPQDAAREAVAPLTNLYRFGTDPNGNLFRAPRTAADVTGNAAANGLDLIRTGMRYTTYDLTANDGALVYAAGKTQEPLTETEKKRRVADYINHFGIWTANGPETGAQLMIPDQRGGFTLVSDKWGRPIIRTWAQLQLRSGKSSQSPNPLPPDDPSLKTWLQPPPPTPRVAAPGAPAGAAHPIPAPQAYSNQTIFRHLSAQVQHQESRGNPNVVSRAGAVGLMQLMPATAQAAAARLGITYSPGMLTDPKMNKRLGENELWHQVVVANGAVPLALAAYNAGGARVYGGRDPHTGAYKPGWIRTLGDPRSGAISFRDWIEKIPFKETRDYVREGVLGVSARLGRGG